MNQNTTSLQWKNRSVVQNQAKIMEREWRRWGVLVAATWIQALTGTNLDFSAYSTQLKSVLQISQLQLSFLSMASDMGKAFGWCSGVSLLHFPLWLVVFLAAFLGLLGYGLQWLLISDFISLPYFLVCVLCLLAGCSVCWFNTVCYVLCIRNFPSNRSLALSLSISFNGLTAAIYTLIVNAIDSDSNSLYLLLNATIPLLTSIISLVPISYHHQQQTPISSQASLLQPMSAQTRLNSFTFVVLYVLAIFTGLYVILLNSVSSMTSVITRVIFLGAILLLFLIPLLLLGLIFGYGQGSRCKDKIMSRFDDVSFNLVDDLYDLHHDLHKELVEPDQNVGCGHGLLAKDQILSLGEEHTSRSLVRRWDFWLYYLAYLGGGTIGLVYSNNLGQIVQSLGFKSETTFFVSVYSTCSFFGRLLAAVPDFLSNKFWFARTGWLAMAIVPTPIAFFLLVSSGSWVTLCISTILLGLSSGFVFAAAVSVTSELFGPNSAGLNHNILITNIPIGSVSYGILAAVIYDSNAGSDSGLIMAVSDVLGDEMVCMGRDCYLRTFIWFGCISSLGLVCSWVLFVRTKYAYDQFRKNMRRADSLL